MSLEGAGPPHAPGTGTLLCLVTGVEEDGLQEVCVESDGAVLSVLVFRRGIILRAYLNRCPHFSLPLNARPGSFLLLSGDRLMCAWHCAIFRLTDGLCVDGPARGMALDALPVAAQDGAVVVV